MKGVQFLQALVKMQFGYSRSSQAYHLLQPLLTTKDATLNVHICTQISVPVEDPKVCIQETFTWKAVGWMERERSLLLWSSRYSRLRTEARAPPGILLMEFFSRCSSTRLRGKPSGTTLRLLFDRSRHSRLPSWLAGEKNRRRESH